jgi:uncharacterized membrane protein
MESVHGSLTAEGRLREIRWIRLGSTEGYCYPDCMSALSEILSMRRPRVRPPLRLVAAMALAIAVLWSLPAQADFRLCNNTSSRVGIALGYKDAEGWTTEGWWNVSAKSCETLLRGTLVARYYYIYAIDYDRGGEWSGQAFMCSRDKEFTIRGTEDCLARGFDRTGFFEVDTGEQRAWTVQLTEAGEQNIQRPLPGLPGGTSPSGGIPGGTSVPPSLPPSGAPKK